jgi:hypothetical protein
MSLRSLADHETEHKAPQWLRSTVRHHLKLNGLSPVDERFYMTDEDYAKAVEEVKNAHGQDEMKTSLHAVPTAPILRVVRTKYEPKKDE